MLIKVKNPKVVSSQMLPASLLIKPTQVLVFCLFFCDTQFLLYCCHLSEPDMQGQGLFVVTVFYMDNFEKEYC